MKKALIQLVKVKSIVTLMLTAVYCILAERGMISGEQFVTIFSTVTAFYFGTQTSNRKEDANGSD